MLALQRCGFSTGFRSVFLIKKGTDKMIWKSRRAAPRALRYRNCNGSNLMVPCRLALSVRCQFYSFAAWLSSRVAILRDRGHAAACLIPRERFAMTRQTYL